MPSSRMMVSQRRTVCSLRPARRPNLVGALVVKAAAHGNPGDAARGRHRRDFVVLARLLRASDFASEELSKKDRQRLRSMIAAINVDNETLLEIHGGQGWAEVR